MVPVIIRTKTVKVPHFWRVPTTEYLFTNIGHPLEASDRYVIYGIDGCGTVWSKFVSSVGDARTAFSELVNPVFPSKFQTGTLCLYYYDRRVSEFVVSPDPLGTGITYVFEDEDVFACSSDLSSLVFELKRLGIKLSPSGGYFASSMLVGSGGLYHSPYEGISVLDRFTFLRLSDDGVEYVKYWNRIHNDVNLRSYETLVSDIVDDYIANTQSAYLSNSNFVISHLTGGIDSRIMLAIQIQLGFAKNTFYYVGGVEPEPDVVIARKLASHFRLTMTKSGGISDTLRPSSLIDEYAAALYHSHGLVATPAKYGSIGSGALIISGGHGGLIRRVFPSPSLDSGDFPLLTSMFSSIDILSPSHINRLFKTEFFSDIESRLLKHLKFPFTHDISGAGASIWLYGEIRARYFIGEISRSVSRLTPRFDPQYSVRGHLLATHAQGEYPLISDIQLSILKEVSPELLSLPFDRPRLTDNFQAHHPDIIESAFEDKGTVRYLEGPSPMKLGGRSVDSLPPLSDELVRRAVELKIPVRLMRNVEHMRKFLYEARIWESELYTSDIYEADALMRLLSNTPRWRPQFRVIEKLFQVYAWSSSL